MVHEVTFWNHAHRLDGVDVVICGFGTQGRFHQALCGKLQFLRNDHAANRQSDLQATFVGETSDIDNALFQRGLVQVSGRSWHVAEVRTQCGWVSAVTQRNTVTAVVRTSGIERIVQYRSGLHLLGVGHRTSQCFGVARSQAVIEVILNGLFGQGERQSDGFVGVTSSERFLCGVIVDASTFVLGRGFAEAGQHDLFFEGTIRRFN